jgi:hypothetical protein
MKLEAGENLGNSQIGENQHISKQPLTQRRNYKGHCKIL